MFKKLKFFLGIQDPSKLEIDGIDDIPDSFIVHIYKNKPIFVEFLMENDANICFFNNVKQMLPTKKWCELSHEDKCYYLSNKLSYYESLIEVREQEDKGIDLQMDEKIKNIDKLNENLNEKEAMWTELLKHNSESYNITLNENRQIESLNKLIEKTKENISEIQRKIKECDKMIHNYESPSNGLPFKQILSALKEEKKRLKSEMNQSKEHICDLKDHISFLKDSIYLLELKKLSN